MCSRQSFYALPLTFYDVASDLQTRWKWDAPRNNLRFRNPRRTRAKTIAGNLVAHDTSAPPIRKAPRTRGLPEWRDNFFVQSAS